MFFHHAVKPRLFKQAVRKHAPGYSTWEPVTASLFRYTMRSVWETQNRVPVKKVRSETPCPFDLGISPALLDSYSLAC
jgi:hypothetical protein